MLRKFVTAAVLAAVSGITVSHAQTVSQIGGPKELPPAGFKGQMYVDSRGCVFLRAGLNGTANWVPRVSRNRKALCGYPPTLAAMAKPVEVATPAEMAAPPAAVASAAPAPRAAGKPLNTVASLTTPPAIRATTARPVDPALARVQPAQIVPPAAVMMAQAPVVSRVAPPVAQVAPPASQGVTYRQAGPGAGQIGCYASAPVPRVVALSNGGSAVLCTRGDGSLHGLRAPIYGKVAMGEGPRMGAGLYPPAGQKVARGNVSADQLGVTGRATVVSRGTEIVTYSAPQRIVVAEDVVVVPKGYKRAWTDDRLNPYRGVGSAQGQYEQDQVWTRQVPAQLAPQGQQRVIVSTKGQPAGRVRVSAGGGNLHVSSKSEPQMRVTPAPQVQLAPRGGFYVQVGTFGVPANAEGAKARLRAAGLPVGSAKTSKGGKALQMVMAGPFGDAGSAQSALSMARSAGFGDAYIR